MADPYAYAKAEAEYYSDRMREQGIAECEFHEGQPKNYCPDCEAAYEEWCEMQGDADREERAFRDD